MKIKKFIFAASGLAVGSGLLGTVLTSCSCTKSSIDSKLKIDLNDEGKLSKNLGFADAVKDALTRSSNWTQFKNALANEIVYRWYADRASEKQDSSTKNNTFKINLDEWNKQINKDYENTVKNLKNKYGKDYQFYLQNEYLSPNGGTESAYKHSKLVEKVRTEFISKVFQTNYFGYAGEGAPSGEDRQAYPHIYTKATSNIAKETLNNPESWSKLGFFASVNPSFQPGFDKTDINTDFLAKNPDGDYATIQNFVFDKWFETEKPFFSAAALFKYSNPSTVKAITDIYDETKVKIGTDKEAGKASETFPFFGGSEISAGNTGTRAYKSFMDNLQATGFETLYTPAEGKKRVSNGTTTIDKTDSEDSQTLLLCFGNKIHSGSSDTLVIPYANAAASLYMQMVDPDNANKYQCLNTREQTQIIDLLDKEAIDLNADSMAILGNFFYNTDPKASGTKITSYLDLEKVYGKVGDGVYHCPLFKENNIFTKFYGTDTAAGIQYITNAFQADLSKDGITDTQPWVFELNTYGMHVQTIDGFKVVKKADPADRVEAAKNVLKYRLMQKKCFSYDWISSSVFGDSGKLKSYFNDNFTNIILEMAMSENKAVNIFRQIDTFTEKKDTKPINFFFEKLSNEEKFSSYASLKNFVEATNTYDANKKLLDAYIATNTKIQDYRTKQIENSRVSVEHRKTIYGNGLLAPTAFAVATQSYDSGKVSGNVKNNTYKIAEINLLKINANGEFAPLTLEGLNKTTLNDLLWKKDSQTSIQYYAEQLLGSTAVNQDSAFSPQVSAAKSAGSNRYWYKSYIVDKMMYPYMSNKEGMANAIKIDAIKQYTNKIINSDVQTKLKDNANLDHAFALTYGENKLFSNNKNYANYGATGDDASKFYTNLENGYSQYIADVKRENGAFASDVYNEAAFKAALVYLIGDVTNKDSGWTNFYKALNSKISDEEMAFTGYVSKMYTDVAGTEAIKKATSNLSDGYDKDNQYAWTADVNNIFDETYKEHYDDGTSKYLNARPTADQYWHVINKQVGNDLTDAATLSGFTGLQTKTNNQLDSASKLQAAAFDGLAEATETSKVLSDLTRLKAEQAKYSKATILDGTNYATNFGCWFAYEGVKDTNGNYYSFDEISYTDKSSGTTTKISSADFIDGEWYSPALKLARKIAKCKTPDDLRSLAAKLGNMFHGDSVFRQIGDGSLPLNNVNQIKITMLQQLPRKADKATNLQCFMRMRDVELHTGGVAPEAYKYTFDDKKGNGYRLILTQLNKADVVEKKLAPTWDATKKAFVSNTESPLSDLEFFYILCALANESSIQQLAITEVVKEVYGDEKLVVYDAELYNQFDTTWIKDWSKKTMGA